MSDGSFILVCVLAGVLPAVVCLWPKIRRRPGRRRAAIKERQWAKFATYQRELTERLLTIAQAGWSITDLCERRRSDGTAAEGGVSFVPLPAQGPEPLDLWTLLERIASELAKDCRWFGWPSFVRLDAEGLEGYGKQESEIEGVEFEYVDQRCGIGGDDWHGSMLYPWRDGFIKVEFQM